MSPQALAALHQIYVVGLLATGSGTIAAGLTQLLKLPFIAIPAERYPVVVSLIISLGLSAVAVFGLHMIVLTGWVSWLVFSAATAFTADNVYHLVKKAVDQLQGY